MNVPFGENIKIAWRTSGLSQKEFAEKLNMSLRNAQTLFDRDDFSIQQLINISKVLNTDFVGLYMKENASGEDYPDTEIISPDFKNALDSLLNLKKAETNEISVQLNIKGEFSSVVKYLPDLMNKIKREAEDRGLHLS